MNFNTGPTRRRKKSYRKQQLIAIWHLSSTTIDMLFGFGRSSTNICGQTINRKSMKTWNKPTKKNTSLLSFLNRSYNFLINIKFRQFWVSNTKFRKYLAIGEGSHKMNWSVIKHLREFRWEEMQLTYRAQKTDTNYWNRYFQSSKSRCFILFLVLFYCPFDWR